jgi:hypothetical protein
MLVPTTRWERKYCPPPPKKKERKKWKKNKSKCNILLIFIFLFLKKWFPPKYVLTRDYLCVKGTLGRDDLVKTRFQRCRAAGLVVRVSGYRSTGPGFDSRRYQIFWEVVGLERGPLSLVRTIEELLEWKSSGSGLILARFLLILLRILILILLLAIHLRLFFLLLFRLQIWCVMWLSPAIGVYRAVQYTQDIISASWPE